MRLSNFFFYHDDLSYTLHVVLSAEYQLDVIGAGATASTATDWHEAWKNSKEAIQVQEELEAIHKEGRERPAVEATLHSEFATSWGNQTTRLFYRDLLSHFRDPTYILAKLALNIFAGLFVSLPCIVCLSFFAHYHPQIGFTFFKAGSSQQDTQNKLFVRLFP